VECPEPGNTALPALSPGIQKGLQNRMKVCSVAGYKGQLVNLCRGRMRVAGRTNRYSVPDDPPRRANCAHLGATCFCPRLGGWVGSEKWKCRPGPRGGGAMLGESGRHVYGLAEIWPSGLLPGISARSMDACDPCGGHRIPPGIEQCEQERTDRDIGSPTRAREVLRRDRALSLAINRRLNPTSRIPTERNEPSRRGLLRLQRCLAGPRNRTPHRDLT
jgi:hypothetical protein